jgi:ribosome maturation factor RimP
MPLYHIQILDRQMKSGPVRTRSFLLPDGRPIGDAARVSDENQTVAATPDAVDDRLIRETGMEARVASIIIPMMNAMDFKLVRVHLSGQNGYTLQIMAERADGSMSVEDCEQLSKAISPVLDVEDPIGRAYHLEISSPGIDRQLVRKSDFTRWGGYSMKLETIAMINGKKRFKGKLVQGDDDGFNFVADNVAYGEEPRMHVSYDNVADARLLLTDELIREALKRDKALREAQGIGEDEIQGGIA